MWRAIVRGIERDRRSVYSSKLFRLVLLLDRLLPFTRRIEQPWSCATLRSGSRSNNAHYIYGAIESRLLLSRSPPSF